MRPVLRSGSLLLQSEKSSTLHSALSQSDVESTNAAVVDGLFRAAPKDAAERLDAWVGPDFRRAGEAQKQTDQALPWILAHHQRTPTNRKRQS